MTTLHFLTHMFMYGTMIFFGFTIDTLRRRIERLEERNRP